MVFTARREPPVPSIPARLAEVEPADELSNDEEIDPVQGLAAERRPGRHVLGNDGSQVGEALDELAELKQRCLGTLARRQVIVPRVADGAEENRRSARAGGRWSSLGNPGAHGTSAAEPNGNSLVSSWCENLDGNGLESPSALPTDLGADAVTGKDGDRKLHRRGWYQDKQEWEEGFSPQQENAGGAFAPPGAPMRILSKAFFSGVV